MRRMLRDEYDVAYVWQLYNMLKNVHKVGEQIGYSGETVRQYLIQNGYKLDSSKWMPEEDKMLREYYNSTPDGQFSVQAIADKLKRPYSGVAGRASTLKLTSRTRAARPDSIAKMSRSQCEHLKLHPHPRGMAGKKHSAATCKIIGQKSREQYARRTPEEKKAQVQKSIETKIQRYRHAGNMSGNHHSMGIDGERVVGKQRVYFRSRWEANYARYLEILKNDGHILDWQYEPHRFVFPRNRSGVRSYAPDFKIIYDADYYEWMELKGWRKDKDVHKEELMDLHHPSEVILYIDKAGYNDLQDSCAHRIPDWEYERPKIGGIT